MSGFPLVYTGPPSVLRARRGAALRTDSVCRKVGKGGAMGGVRIETEDGERWLVNGRHVQKRPEPKVKSKVTLDPLTNIATCTCGWAGVPLNAGGCPVCVFR